MRWQYLAAAFLMAGCGDDSPISSPTTPSPIGEVQQHAASPAVAGDANGLGTDSLPTNSVPGTTPLTASFSGVPANHDDSAFSFMLDLSENIAGLSYQTLNDTAFTVTHGAVTNASRRAPPSNQSWEITVDPEAGESVEITLPATTDCLRAGAICTPSGRMLSNHTSATVPPPNTGTPPGGTSATVQFQDTAIDPGSERSVTIALNQTGTIPARASVDVALSGNAVSRLECAARGCEKLTYNSWAGTYTVPLSQGASTTFRALMNRPLADGASSTLTLSASGVSIGGRGVLTVSAVTSVIVPRECLYERPGGVINAYTFPTVGGGFNYYLRPGSGCPSGAYGLGKEETAAWVSMSHVSWTGHPCGNTTLTACRKLVIQAQPHTGPLTRSVRVRITLGAATPFPWFTVTQHGANHAPTVTLTCESPPCDEAEAEGMIEFQAEGADPNGDTVTYAWTSMGVGNGGTLTPMTGAEVTWSAPDAVGDVTVTVTATESHADGKTAEASQTISVIPATVCAVETGRADVTTGFPAAGALDRQAVLRSEPGSSTVPATDPG